MRLGAYGEYLPRHIPRRGGESLDGACITSLPISVQARDGVGPGNEGVGEQQNRKRT